MPPRRRSVHEVEIEELRRQVQLLQEMVNVQQAQLDAQGKQIEDDSDSSDTSSAGNHQPRRPIVRNNDIKVDIPDFEGKLQPDEFVEWLQTVERVFEYKEVPEDQKVKIVAIKLKKHASMWWENLKRKHEREGKSKIRI